MHTWMRGTLLHRRCTQAVPGPGIAGQVSTAVQQEMRGKVLPLPHPGSVHVTEQHLSGFKGKSGRTPKGHHFHFHGCRPGAPTAHGCGRSTRNSQAHWQTPVRRLIDTHRHTQTHALLPCLQGLQNGEWRKEQVHIQMTGRGLRRRWALGIGGGVGEEPEGEKLVSKRASAAGLGQRQKGEGT